MHIEISKYLQSRLERLRNCVAVYVLRKYSNTLDVINLNWLSVAENTGFELAKLAYQRLHEKNWPEYLSSKLIEQIINLWFHWSIYFDIFRLFLLQFQFYLSTQKTWYFIAVGFKCPYLYSFSRAAVFCMHFSLLLFILIWIFKYFLNIHFLIFASVDFYASRLLL